MKRKPINRPLSYLPVITDALTEELAASQEQYQTLLPAIEKPHVLDDEIVNRIIRVLEEKKPYIDLYKRQFDLWRKEKLTTDQSTTIYELESKLTLLEEVINKILKLAYDIQPHTIDKIMNMDPAKLALSVLSGKIKNPL